MKKSLPDHQKRLKKLYFSFEQNCLRIAALHNVEPEFSGWTYKDNKQKPDQLIGNTAVLDFGSYGIVFSYRRFNMIRQATSIVRIDISLKTADGMMVIPTDALMNIMNPVDFTPFQYQDIYDETVMSLVFNELNAWFIKYKSDIEKLVKDPDEVAILITSIREDMAVYFSKQLEQKRDIDDYYLNYMIFRFSMSNYQFFLMGNYKKSLSSYLSFNKHRRFIAYEKRMVELMEVRSSIEGFRPKVLINPLIEDNYRYFRFLGFHPYHKQSMFSYFASAGAMLIPSSALAYALMWILAIFVSSGTLYASTPSWDLGLMIGFIFAFIGALPVWPWMHGRLYKKDHERYLNLKALVMSDVDRKVLQICAVLGLVLFHLLSVLAAFDQVTLRDKTFTVDNFFNDMSLLKSYEYDQIDHVEYRTSVIMDGEEEPYENYTIIMKDGKELYLYSSISIQTIESKILPIFIEKDVTVIKRQP